MKQTPLYDRHVQTGGKIVDFGGWALPIQYGSIIEEHLTVRKKAGLFDVSHMGELMLCGPDALANLQQLMTNDLRSIEINQAVYSPICTPDGGVVDDLIVYKFSDECWLLVVNASNTEKDEAWIRSVLFGDVQLTNISAETAQLAIQGPEAQNILQGLTDVPLGEIRNYRFQRDVPVAGLNTLVSRTGYTGEDGFELYLAAADAPRLWDLLLEAGHSSGLIPVGLGARDTLRLESGMPLYGHELAMDITPLEAGLDRFVKLEKTAFHGREVLLSQREAGLARKLVGLQMIDRGVPRADYEIRVGDRVIGKVTSGTNSPTFKTNIAMALIASEYTAIGTVVDVIIRGQPVQANVVKLPFYRRNRI